MHSNVPVTSSWTAINQSNSGQTYTPQTPRTPHTPRSAPALSSTSHVEAATVKRKRRPTIARYLGLNDGVGLLHLDEPIESSASLLAQVPAPELAPSNTQRKRTQKTQGDDKPQKQRRMVDGLPVTKPTSRKQVKPKGVLEDSSVGKNAPPNPPNSSTVSATVPVHNTVSLTQVVSDSQVSSRAVPASRTQQSSRNTSQKSPTKAHMSGSKTIEKSDPLPAEHSSSDSTVRISASIYSSQDAAEFFDDDIDEILESIDFVDFADDFSTDNQVQNSSPAKPSARQLKNDTFDDAFDDGLDDDELLRLTTNTINDCPGANNCSHVFVPLSYLSPPLIDLATDANQSVTIDLTKSLDLRRQFVSPVTGHTQSRIRDIDPNEQRKPIVRPVFPSQARGRSPIIGLTSNTLLRTCFRIGEAINSGRSAVKCGKNIILELYARVLYSKRYNNKQSFVFCDLYHINAPYINAVYDAAIWKADNQFNYDSARLLQEMKMCRCIGKMKKEGNEWVLAISSVWEASWEDIDWVEGIVNS